MPLVMIVAAPLLPVCFLVLLLWLAHLEDTLDRDIRRQQAAARSRARRRRPADGGQPAALRWSPPTSPSPANR